MTIDELYHHGILGQKWGIRRYQNEDGSLTELGRKRYLDSEGKLNKAGQQYFVKQDSKWAKKYQDKIYNETYSKVDADLKDYIYNVLNPKYNGQVGRNYINAFNKKMAQLMNERVDTYTAPSGRVVQFVAKRGNIGVYTALASVGYDMSSVKNGVWTGGRIAYRKNSVDVMKNE